MSREALLRELAAYEPADEHERAMTLALATFVRRQSACYERTLLVGHLTASAWVVDGQRTHALLTHHRKLGRWLQLGGHADGDDDLRRVALREAREESGLTRLRFASESIYDIDIHRIPARAGEPEHDHHDVRFAFIADRGEPLVVSAESHDLAWVPIDALATVKVDESVQRLARKTSSLPVGGGQATMRR